MIDPQDDDDEDNNGRDPDLGYPETDKRYATLTRDDPGLIALPGDRVVVFGGMPNSHDPHAEAITIGSSERLRFVDLTPPRSRAAITRVATGALVIGGWSLIDDHTFSDIQHLDLESLAWTGWGALPVELQWHTATPHGSGVVVLGGQTADGDTLAASWIVDSTGVVPGPALHIGRARHAVCALPDGLLVVGGIDQGVTLADVERYAPRSTR